MLVRKGGQFKANTPRFASQRPTNGISGSSHTAHLLESDARPTQTPVQPASPLRREAEIGRRMINDDFH